MGYKVSVSEHSKQVNFILTRKILYKAVPQILKKGNGILIAYLF